MQKHANSEGGEKKDNTIFSSISFHHSLLSVVIGRSWIFLLSSFKGLLQRAINKLLRKFKSRQNSWRISVQIRYVIYIAFSSFSVVHKYHGALLLECMLCYQGAYKCSRPKIERNPNYASLFHLIYV